MARRSPRLQFPLPAGHGGGVGGRPAPNAPRSTRSGRASGRMAQSMAREPPELRLRVEAHAVDAFAFVPARSIGHDARSGAMRGARHRRFPDAGTIDPGQSEDW